MEPECSLSHSQVPASCSYPEPAPSSPCPPPPTFHFLKIHNFTFFFQCLGPTNVSVQDRGFLCQQFVTRYVFTVRSCLHLAQNPSCRTTPYRLSTTAYSIYSQLPSILEAVSPSAAWRRATPWWRGPHLSRTLQSTVVITLLLRRWCALSYTIVELQIAEHCLLMVQ